MRKWATQNKRIATRNEWLPATSVDWLNSTTGAQRIQVPDWTIPEYAHYRYV